MSALFGNKVIRVRDQWAEYKCGAIIPPAPDNGAQLVSIAPNLSKHSILTTQAVISWDLSSDWELGGIDSICWAVKQVIGYTTSSKCRSVTSCEMNDVWRCLCCDMQCVVTTRGLPRTMSPDDGLSLVRCQWCGPLIGQHSVVITGGLPRSGGHIAESGANCSIAPKAIRQSLVICKWVFSTSTSFNILFLFLIF